MNRPAHKRPVTIRSGEKLEPFASEEESTFLNRLNKVVAVCQAVLNCRNFKVSENNLFVTGSSVAGSAAKAFVITTLVEADYYIARELSNFRDISGTVFGTVGSGDVLIAKPPTIRRSITSELIDGFTITYRDTGSSAVDNNRIANDGDDDESQCVYPRYTTLSTLGFTTTCPTHAQCVVYAVQTDGLAGVVDDDGNALDWLEILPARVWAKRNAP